MTTETTKVKIEGFNFYYGDFLVLKGISAAIFGNAVTAIIGPSGCGKSTLLRSLNRMNDLIPDARAEGAIRLDGKNIYDPDVDLVWLRARIGMVFQQPVAFPLSIFDNVAAAPRVRGIRNRAQLAEIVEKSLEAVGLWSKVKDGLHRPGLSLPVGDQQKLCIARAIATQPDVLLFDEPCSALDPISTLVIEDLMLALSENYTIVIVTHNMQQAARASDYTMFLLDGKIVEYGPTRELFTSPKDIRTENYVSGKIDQRL